MVDKPKKPEKRLLRPGRENKEKIIHTRVPGQLDQEIKKRADGLGLSVSNLVRNVLENTFGLVESIVHDSRDIARSARGDVGALRGTAGPPAPTAEAPVLGWQPIVLAINAVCEKCNAILPAGSRGAIAVSERPRTKTPFLCPKCLEEITHVEPTE